MITFNTSTPNALLVGLKAAIDQKKIATWSYSANGYFTHTPTQWYAKAWLLPSAVAGGLQFAIINPRNANITTEVYAVYHGRFIEMMLAHFDTDVTAGVATSMPTSHDRVKAA